MSKTTKTAAGLLALVIVAMLAVGREAVAEKLGEWRRQWGRLDPRERARFVGVVGGSALVGWLGYRFTLAKL